MWPGNKISLKYLLACIVVSPLPWLRCRIVTIGSKDNTKFPDTG